MLNINSGQPSTYFPLKINKRQEILPVVPIQFPSTRNVLWQSKPVGCLETLSLTAPKRDVELFVVEKTLRLAQRYSEGSHSFSFLLGTAYSNTDEGGISVGVDRFDPGREVTEKIGGIVSKCKVPTAVVPGDHIIPIKVKNELLDPADSLTHTKEEFSRALQIMVSKISGKDSITLSHVISLKANVYCAKNDIEVIINLHCVAIVPNVKFQAQPIAPLPIIPTALARNLQSDIGGAPKMGYITMDQTRKLLLLLETDPKAYNLPLIGVWVSGLNSAHDPYVWAACLRYFNCTEIKDRVLHYSGSFLLLHYSVVQRLPDFWECRSNNDENLNFELLSCQEELHLNMDCNPEGMLCFHLSAAADSMNKALFDEAIDEWKSEGEVSRSNKTNPSRSLTNIPPGSPGVVNYETPRPTPSPRPSPTQGNAISPPVPEDSLSLSFDDMANNSNKEDVEKRKEGRKILAPHFNGPAKRHSMKQVSKPSRQPFKQISSQNPAERAQNIPRERARSNTPAKTLMIGCKGDKENTPLTSVKNVKCVRESEMNTGKTRTSPVVAQTNKVLLNQSPSDHYTKEQQRSSKEDDVKVQSKKTSPASQDLTNNSNARNVTLSEPRSYLGENRFSCSQRHENRPKPDFHEPCNEEYPPHLEKTLARRSSVVSSNEENSGDISADPSSREDCEDTVNDRKIIDNRKIREVTYLHNNSRNFTDHEVISKHQDGFNIEHSQKQPQKVDSPDEHQSRTNAPLPLEEEKQQAVERVAGDLASGKLQEQVKHQEDMIRVLQEQVRSLLKMKEEDISSPRQDHCLPMTPASTPESNDGRILNRHTEKQMQNHSVSSLAVQTDGDVIEDDSEPNRVTVGVNTGASLLWNEPLQDKSRCVRCCDCDSSRKSKSEAEAPSSYNAEDSSDKLTPEKTESLENLSEVVVENESNQSFPLTLNVDIPSFDESGGSAAPDQNSPEKKSSFSLGESASTVSNQSKLSSCSEQSSHSDAVSVKGREFYDKLLFQVKDLLNEHVEDGGENESPQIKSSSEAEQEVKDNAPTAIIPTREVVVKATLKELEKIKHSEHERPGSSSSRLQDGSSSIFQTYQRSMSTSFIPDHPRLNYISMSVNETFDEVTYVDEIAQKYLSDEEIGVFNNELRPATGAVKRSFSRTVRFGSLPNDKERTAPSKELRSRREVDFTWNNLSFCTKNYLTKYNLVEKQISFSARDEEKNGKNRDSPQSSHDNPQTSLEIACKPPFPSPVRKRSEDNEILDIQRLKNLPKLF